MLDYSIVFKRKSVQTNSIVDLKTLYESLQTAIDKKIILSKSKFYIYEDYTVFGAVCRNFKTRSPEIVYNPQNCKIIGESLAHEIGHANMPSSRHKALVGPTRDSYVIEEELTAWIFAELFLKSINQFHKESLQLVMETCISSYLYNPRYPNKSNVLKNAAKEAQRRFTQYEKLEK